MSASISNSVSHENSDVTVEQMSEKGRACDNRKGLQAYQLDNEVNAGFLSKCYAWDHAAK